MSDFPAGWYDDNHGNVRWWDGDAWTAVIKPPDKPKLSDKEVARLALELFKRTWGNPTQKKFVKSFTKPVRVQNQELETPITMRNAKRIATDQRGLLADKDDLIAKLELELAHERDENAELKQLLADLKGLSMLEVTRLTRAARVVYENATEALDEELARQRKELAVEKTLKLIDSKDELPDPREGSAA